MLVKRCQECHRSSLTKNFLSTRTKNKSIGVCRACDAHYWLKHSTDVLAKYNEFIKDYPSDSDTRIQNGYMKKFIGFLYDEYWYFQITPAAFSDVLSFFKGLDATVATDNAVNINYFLGCIHTEKVRA